MRIISIVIYNFSPLPSVIFSADGADRQFTIGYYNKFQLIVKVKKSSVYADKQICNLQFFSATIRHFLR